MPNLTTGVDLDIVRGAPDGYVAWAGQTGLEISRFSLDAYIRWLSNNNTQGLMAPMYTAPITYSRRGKPTERVENSFSGYVMGGYKSNPIVFGVMKRRSSVFSEARFMWRHLDDGTPGDLFWTDELDALAHPWPNGTTGELLTRMIQDVDLAGNSYLVNEGDRLRRLRPDWVQIVLSGDPLTDPDIDVVGYVFTPGGPDNGTGKAYQVGEVCHWSPIPDPEASYRGMSWLTPVIREIQADQAAVEHKLNFFRQGATLGPIIKVSDKFTPEQFKEFIRANEEAHGGVDNAYKTMYLGGGADVTLAAANFQQMDFSGAQGKAETRICVAGGVPAVIAGVSEGLQGSSLNAGNYNAAKRSFVDGELRTLWRSACASLSTVVNVPDRAELWFDESGIAYLRDDAHDIATIQQTQMTAVNSGITAGFEPDTVVDAIVANDLTKLKHTGLTSVQLTPPGQGGELPPDGSAPAGGPDQPVPDQGLIDQALTGVSRATQSQNTGNSAYNELHPHVSSGPTGGQFAPKGQGSGIGVFSGGGPTRSPKKSSGSPMPAAVGINRTLKRGDSGPDVAQLQAAMKVLGFDVPVSGQYDAQTERFVMQAQERLGVAKTGHVSPSLLTKFQDTIKLSPCMDRSRGLDVDDEEDSEDANSDLDVQDEAVRALVEAVEDVIERRYNPDELRVEAGHVGGGRFTKSLVGQISTALRDYLNNGEQGPHPLDSFSQPQLKSAAVQLGLNPPKGMRKPALANLILDHARQGHVSEAPSVPAKAAKKTAARVEPAGTVRAEGYVRGADVEMRVIADGNGGYVGQRRPRGTTEWQDAPGLGTGSTPREITSRQPRGQWSIISARVAASQTPTPVATPRDAARERNRHIESAHATERLLAEVDELLGNKADHATINERLAEANFGPDGPYHGADPAVVESLRKAVASGKPASVRAAVTRGSTKARLAPIGKAGMTTQFDPATMESHVDIPAGAKVKVTRRGSTLTLPDGTSLSTPLTKAQVVTVEPVKRAPRKAATRPPYIDAEGSLLLEKYAEHHGMDLRRYLDPERRQMVTAGEPVETQRPFSYDVALIVDGLKSGKVNQQAAIRDLRQIRRRVERDVEHARQAVARGYPTNRDRAIIRDAGLPDVADRLANELEGLKLPKRQRRPTLGALTQDEIPQFDEARFAVPKGTFMDGPSPKGGLVLHRGQVVPESFEHPRSGFGLLQDTKAPVRPGLTEAENHALDLYVSSAVADPLNQALRAGTEPPTVDLTVLGEKTPVDLREVRDTLDRIIADSELSRDTTLYRGAMMRPHDIRNLQPGAIITEPGYMSTAADQRLARNIIGWRKKNAPAYQKPVIFHILAPAHTPAAVGHEAAGEVMFGRGTRLQVIRTEDEKWSGTKIVTALMLRD